MNNKQHRAVQLILLTALFLLIASVSLVGKVNALDATTSMKIIAIYPVGTNGEKIVMLIDEDGELYEHIAPAGFQLRVGDVILAVMTFSKEEGGQEFTLKHMVIPRGSRAIQSN